MSFRSKGVTRTILPFGLDYSDVLSTNFDTEKPRLILPVNAPLSDKEKDESVQAINFSKLVLDGLFYTGNTLDDKQKTTSLTLPDGIERHADKYKKVKKIGTTVEDHPFNLEFFPAELYPVMGVSKKKKLGLSTYKSTTEMNNGINGHSFITDEEEQAKQMVEKLKDMAEDLDTKEGEGQEEEEEEADDMEDEYEDDEDDDYNAERYFDDGNEDYADNDDDEAAF